MHDLHAESIAQCLARMDWPAIRAAVVTRPPAEIADPLRAPSPGQRHIVFCLVSRGQASLVFAFMEPEEQNALLSEMTNEETRGLLARMNPDDRTHLFEELQEQITQIRGLRGSAPRFLQQAGAVSEPWRDR